MSTDSKSLEDVAKELLSFSGKVRGEIVLNHIEYIREKEGEGGLKKLTKKLEELGVPANLHKTKPLDWVEEGISALIIIASKEVFFWEEKDVFEMGRIAPQFSLSLKMIAQNFVPPKRLFEESPTYWNNLFDFGKIEPVRYSEKYKSATIRIKEYKTHPLICIYHAGYLQGITEFVLKTKKVSVKETRCIYKGDSCNEYKLSWK